MSVHSLRSEVSRLESELRRVQAINNELRGELATVTNGVSRAQSQLENFNAHIQNTLQSSTNMMDSSHSRVVEAIALQGEIEKIYVRFKNIELANKKIREANNKKFYDFATFRTVRKIVQGIMDNLDVHMVSNNTITKSVETQHLQSPDYWLTCALISVMAWKNDDKALAERALARAVSLDKKHSSIFLMLFNLRMERDEAALKWFGMYQQCEQKGSDQRTFLMLFSLISKTLSDNVSEESRGQISQYINSVLLSNAEAEDFDESDIVTKIKYQYSRLRSSGQMEYPLLKKYCLSSELLNSNLILAKNNINILEFIIKLINVPIDQRNEFIKDFVDELISAPNPTEESVYDDIAYNELVIKLEGEVEAAKEQFAEQQQLAMAEINLIVEITNWVFDKNNPEINGQSRLNMFTLTKDFQKKAIISYADDYRSKQTSVLPISINEYSTDMDFKNATGEKSKIERFYEDKKNAVLSTIKDWKAYVGFGVALLSAAGAFFVGMFLLIVTALAAGYGVFVLLSNKSQKKQAELSCFDSIRTTTDIMQNLFSEFSRYGVEFDEYDTYHDKIINELNKI